jgi:hypothetical protein
MGDNAADCRVDAEWIMEKKDWRQQQQESVRQERTTTSAVGGGSGSPTDGSSSSPLGDYGLGVDGKDYVAANAYLHDMDEMRCLLWAHGGSSVRPSVLSHHSCRPIFFPLLSPSTGGYFFGSVDQER